jgi:hypothetical protein
MKKHVVPHSGVESRGQRSLLIADLMKVVKLSRRYDCVKISDRTVSRRELHLWSSSRFKLKTRDGPVRNPSLPDIKHLDSRIRASFRVDIDQTVTLKTAKRDISRLPCHAAQLVKTSVDSEALTFV